MIVGGAEFASFCQPHESVHHIRGKLGAGYFFDDGNHLVKVHAVAIGTVGVHGVEAIRHSDDLRYTGDFIPFQTVGIPPAVGAFMVRLSADGQLRHDGDLFERFIALGGMGLDNLKFIVRQLTGLVQHLGRYADLADVVQQRDAIVFLHRLLVAAQFLGQHRLCIAPRGKNGRLCICPSYR